MNPKGSPLKRAVWYHDCWVAPGSELHELMHDKDDMAKKKASLLHKKCKAELQWPDDKKHLLNWRVSDSLR